MNKTVPVKPAPRVAFALQCADLLAQLRRDTAGVVSASIATADGLPVASTLTEDPEIDKLAAISGSISALASALSRQVGHGDPDRFILESASGTIVSLKVPGQQGGMVLTVVTDRNAVLGKLLWDCRATAVGVASSASQLAA